MVMCEWTPHQVAFCRTRANAPWKEKFLLREVPDNAACRAGATIGLEDQPDRLLDLLVWIKDYAIQRVVHEPDWQDLFELTASGLAALAANQPSAKDVELRFAHRALEPQQQPVVEMARIVQAVLIQNQRLAQRAQLEQLMPIGRTARQPRNLESEHDTGPRPTSATSC